MLVVALAVGDRQAQHLPLAVAAGEIEVVSLDPEEGVAALELQSAVAAQRAGQEARLGEHLEAVADAQHRAALGGVLAHRLHDRREGRLFRVSPLDTTQRINWCRSNLRQYREAVIEAACRTAYELHTVKKLERIDFAELRGLEGVRAELLILMGLLEHRNGTWSGKCQRASRRRQVRKLNVPSIEVMARPGGCIGGGGFSHGIMETLIS